MLPCPSHFLELGQTHVHWVSDAIQPFHPLSPLLLTPSIFPSIKVFSNESALHIRWPKYWSFSFSISPSNGYSGLISLQIDWFDPFAVQGTLRSLLHSPKASILWHSTFFMVQLSHSYMTTGKTKALTRRTFVGKVMFLLFNTLSRFVIAFLPWSKSLLVSWLQSPCAVIFGAQENKVSHCFPIYLPLSDGTKYHDLCFLNVEFWINFFTVLFPLHQEAVQFFSFCLNGCVIWVSKAIDISPSNLNFSLAFQMMYSEYKLNKQGDNIQPRWTPFQIWNQSVIQCPGLTIAFLPAYKFLRRQVRWSGIPTSLRIFQVCCDPYSQRLWCV